MSEDRTQAPSARRRQLARERGQVAFSPELNAATGLLAASAALAAWGEPLASALLDLVRAPVSGASPAPVDVDLAGVVEWLRAPAWGVAGPLAPVLGAFALGAFAAHQAQTRGLVTPARLAPDLSRLWPLGEGAGLGVSARAGRGLWGVAKGTAVLAVAAWFVRANWDALPALGALGASDLARASGRMLARLALGLSAATLALGFVDLGLQLARFEARLMMTADEQREDLRSMEGDPALRSRRRRLADSWRHAADDILEGASVVLTSPGGLTVVLGGGPPAGEAPRPVSVRSVLDGRQGDRLRREADKAGLPSVSAPGLARKFARRRPQSLPPTPELLRELEPLWPTPAGTA